MIEPQWKGSFPQRFSGGRKTFQPHNQILSGFSYAQQRQSHPTGIRSYSPSPTLQIQYRPHMKTFQQHYTPINKSKQLNYRGIKLVQLPQQKQRIRPQKSHISGGQQTINQINLRGIRSFEQSNKSRQKYTYIQKQLQAKGRITGLQSLRNSIGLTSLGDKSYKYPQYSSNFYNAGGLISGSTHKLRKGQYIPQIKKGTILTRPNYDIVMKKQEKRQDQKILDSIDNWEQTILKQNNPKWNDPDTFFQRQQLKQQGKDNKKLGKK